jgi:hypothetical protein
MTTIRDIFSDHRKIDRRIEKVIDYAAADEDRLAAEIEEYEATENVESNFRKFLEIFQAGVHSGQVTEVGIWVSGFYGSGKSSFTKYLGFALDPKRLVHGQAFLKLLRDRLRTKEIQALLNSTAKNHPTAVMMLDLATEQHDNTNTPISNVLYWKVLRLAGYSREKKLAQLELTLEDKGLYEKFCQEYETKFNGTWEKIHHDPLLGISRASQIMPSILPQDFPTPNWFQSMRFEMNENVRDMAKRMIEVIRKQHGTDNILFLVDEAGQYVAPNGQLILNLDGLARNLKELGNGHVWIVATGQQTLAEIVEKAALNTTELNKLRDRFPISIELDARDIREITYRRLLTKANAGETQLRTLYTEKGQAMILHTRLTGTSLYKNDPTIEDFIRFYPFLPQHFEILLELIRVLARSTGGIGLRSAIRVIQDVLVDTSRILPSHELLLADRPVGVLSTVTDFYKTLRADLNKYMPHVVAGVDNVERMFGAQSLQTRVAQAVAVLQPLENFPRTADNIAALLYKEMGTLSLLDEVRQALTTLSNTKDLRLTEDPQSGGYVFLSETVSPLMQKRNNYQPSGGEVTRVRNELLKDALSPQPSTKLDNVKEVRATLKSDRISLTGDQEDIVIQLQMVSPERWDEQRTHIMSETAQGREYRDTIVWLYRMSTDAEEIFPDIVRSEYIVRPGSVDERSADRDVLQFLRAERKKSEINRERTAGIMKDALMDGIFIFRGRPVPVRQESDTLEAASRSMLSKVAREVFHQHHLVKIRPSTNLAEQFLGVERLDRMTRERDPLHFVASQGGAPRVDINHPALAETLRAFKEKADQSGGQLDGKFIQDFFSTDPYGWSKDAVRYLFAAMLVAGEIEFHADGQIIRTASPIAMDSVKSTVAFNRVGVGIRGSKPNLEVLNRAALRIQEIFGDATILPLEDKISQGARRHFPRFIEQVGALPDRLRLLNLTGEERARALIATLTELLRGDASEAAARLGGTDTTLVDDIRWAREASRALDNDGENDLRQAARLMANLSELEQYLPGLRTRLGIDDRLQMLSVVNQSERFYELLPDVRTTLQIAYDRMLAQLNKLNDAYFNALEKARTELEALPQWRKLQDADRADIGSRLIYQPPVVTTLPEVLNAYKTVLFQYNGLANRLNGLRVEVLQLGAKVEEAGEDVESVSFASIRPEAMISNESELENWLEFLKQRLLEMLQAGKKIRLD